MDIIGELRRIAIDSIFQLASELSAIESGASFLLKECEPEAENDLKLAMRGRMLQVIEDAVARAFALHINESEIREAIRRAYDSEYGVNPV